MFCDARYCTIPGKMEKWGNINLVSNLWAKTSNVINMLFTYCLFVPFKPLLFFVTVWRRIKLTAFRPLAIPSPHTPLHTQTTGCAWLDQRKHPTLKWLQNPSKISAYCPKNYCNYISKNNACTEKWQFSVETALCLIRNVKDFTQTFHCLDEKRQYYCVDEKMKYSKMAIAWLQRRKTFQGVSTAWLQRWKTFQGVSTAWQQRCTTLKIVSIAWLQRCKTSHSLFIAWMKIYRTFQIRHYRLCLCLPVEWTGINHNLLIRYTRELWTHLVNQCDRPTWPTLSYTNFLYLSAFTKLLCWNKSQLCLCKIYLLKVNGTMSSKWKLLNSTFVLQRFYSNNMWK